MSSLNSIEVLINKNMNFTSIPTSYNKHFHLFGHILLNESLQTIEVFQPELIKNRLDYQSNMSPSFLE